MKHRVLAVLTAMIMILAAVPVPAAGAAGYNAHDLGALTAFLNAPSAVEGLLNGEILTAGYDPDDPDSFACDPGAGDSNTYSFAWAKDGGGELRLVSVDIRDKTGLAGELDLSGCEMLEGVSLYDLPRVTGLSLAGCGRLGTLYCRECGVGTIDATGCQGLWMVNAGGQELKAVLLDGFGIFAEGPGAVSALIDGVNGVLAAEPHEGDFLGWFCGGELIGAEPELDITGLDYPEYTARFASAGPVPGDMDGDGELSFVDVSALYGILVSGGGVTPEQLAAGDANGDGELSFADVSALYSVLVS